jgi:type I restriction enzyme M protein
MISRLCKRKTLPLPQEFKADALTQIPLVQNRRDIQRTKNRMQSGYNIREVINRIDELRFRTHADKHEMSHLYEDKIKTWVTLGVTVGVLYPSSFD